MSSSPLNPNKRTHHLPLAASFSRHNFPGGMLAVFILLALALGLLLSWALTVVSISEDQRDGTSGNASEVKLSNTALPVVSPFNIGEEIQSVVNNGRAGASAPFNVSACLQSIDIAENAVAVEQVQWEDKGSSAWLILHSTRNLADIRSAGGSVNAVVVGPRCPDPAASPSAAPIYFWSGTAMVAAVGQG